MRTRNQKSINLVSLQKFLCNFPRRAWASVYVACIWSEVRFPFAFISPAQPELLCGPGVGILCTLHVGVWIESINWVLISERVWVDTIETIFTVEGSSSGTGTLWGSVMEWAALSEYQSIRESWPDGSVTEPDNIVPGFPCTIIIPAPILLLPSSGQKLISRRWESLTTKYSNWNWNNKQTRIGETGSTMCTVIYQAGVRESCVLSLDSVRCIHIHKNSLSI